MREDVGRARASRKGNGCVLGAHQRAAGGQRQDTIASAPNEREWRAPHCREAGRAGWRGKQPSGRAKLIFDLFSERRRDEQWPRGGLVF